MLTAQKIIDALKLAGTDPNLITHNADGEILCLALLVYNDHSDPGNPGWAYRIPLQYDPDTDTWGEHESGEVNDVDDVTALAYRAIALVATDEVLRLTREKIASALLTDCPSALADDHAEIADAIVRGDSCDTIMGMDEVDRWPETYAWLRTVLNEVS